MVELKQNSAEKQMHGSDKAPHAGNPLSPHGSAGGFDSTGQQAKGKTGLKTNIFTKAPDKNQQSVKSPTGTASAVSSSILNASPTSVQIYIQCRGLVDLDFVGQSDPYAELFIKTEKQTEW